jgi:glycosyltransferase involved in cell wall biosynthesis
VRGIWEESHTSRYGISERSFRYRAVRSLEDRALKGADLCCVICEALKEEIVSRGINPEKIVVVPNGVDAATFVPGPAKEELQRRLDLLGCFVIGYIGSFSAYEGLDIAVKGVIRLAEDFPNLRLLLVGDGELRPELERIASEGGIADRVIFTGRIAYSEITDFYRLCDVMVLPRRDARVTRLVTPLKPLEVMAMAKPLLASDIGGHREIVENGVNGMLFKSENVEDLTAQWRLLINNRELRLDLGSKARNWVEKHRNWSVLIERYTDIYDELAGKASR